MYNGSLYMEQLFYSIGNYVFPIEQKTLRYGCALARLVDVANDRARRENFAIGNLVLLRSHPASVSEAVPVRTQVTEQRSAPGWNPGCVSVPAPG